MNRFHGFRFTVQTHTFSLIHCNLLMVVARSALLKIAVSTLVKAADAFVASHIISTAGVCDESAIERAVLIASLKVALVSCVRNDDCRLNNYLLLTRLHHHLLLTWLHHHLLLPGLHHHHLLLTWLHHHLWLLSYHLLLLYWHSLRHFDVVSRLFHLVIININCP